jgi:hypothetical protein
MATPRVRAIRINDAEWRMIRARAAELGYQGAAGYIRDILLAECGIPDDGPGVAFATCASCGEVSQCVRLPIQSSEPLPLCRPCLDGAWRELRGK